MDDRELREAARRRLKARNSFVVLAAVFGIVAAILAVIWAASSGPGSYFWPIWPYLGMGIALLFAGLDAAGITSRVITESDVDRELERMRRNEVP